LETDWRRDSVDLSQFNGEDILIQFETKNGKGNDLYIDNVKVFTGNNEPASIADLVNEVRIYPNPTAAVLNIQFSEHVNLLNGLEIRDVSGRSMFSGNPTISESRASISTDFLETGLYILEIDTDQGQVSKPFLKL
jgi:hypothetical protein